jgi:hypothetical protein
MCIFGRTAWGRIMGHAGISNCLRASSPAISWVCWGTYKRTSTDTRTHWTPAHPPLSPLFPKNDITATQPTSCQCHTMTQGRSHHLQCKAQRPACLHAPTERSRHAGARQLMQAVSNPHLRLCDVRLPPSLGRSLSYDAGAQAGRGTGGTGKHRRLSATAARRIVC